MNKIILGLVASFLFGQSLYGQNNLPQINLNHVFVVLDSITYSRLFEHPFITKKLGRSKTSSVTTTDDAWSGKYLFGKNGYFEFFSTSGYKGATLGDAGLGFITSKSGDILKIKDHWKQNSRDSISADTTVRTDKGKSASWYYAIYLFTPDSAAQFSTWVMENTPEELKATGFTDDEIKKEITWNDYTVRRKHKKSKGLFDRISAVELEVTNQEYDYLQKSLTGFGLAEKDNVFLNNTVKIIPAIVSTPRMRIKTVVVELKEKCDDTLIKISDHLIVEVKGSTATWKFNY